MTSSSRNWKVKFSKDVGKFFKKNKSVLGQIKEAIDILASSPEPEKLGKQLKGTLGDFYSYRRGDYRVVYQVNKNEITIFVLRIGHRKEVYR